MTLKPVRKLGVLACHTRPARRCLDLNSKLNSRAEKSMSILRSSSFPSTINCGLTPDDLQTSLLTRVPPSTRESELAPGSLNSGSSPSQAVIADQVCPPDYNASDRLTVTPSLGWPKSLLFSHAKALQLSYSQPFEGTTLISWPSSISLSLSPGTRMWGQLLPFSNSLRPPLTSTMLLKPRKLQTGLDTAGEDASKSLESRVRSSLSLSRGCPP